MPSAWIYKYLSASTFHPDRTQRGTCTGAIFKAVEVYPPIWDSRWPELRWSWFWPIFRSAWAVVVRFLVWYV